MTEAVEGAFPGLEAGSDLEARLAAVHDQLERARRLLAEGELSALDRLALLLEGVPGELGRFPRTDERLRGRLLALLDEAGSLTETLRTEQARLAVQLRAAGAYRRVGAAYRRASKL
jgi:hypothetical protein